MSLGLGFKKEKDQKKGGEKIMKKIALALCLVFAVTAFAAPYAYSQNDPDIVENPFKIIANFIRFLYDSLGNLIGQKGVVEGTYKTPDGQYVKVSIEMFYEIRNGKAVITEEITKTLSFELEYIDEILALLLGGDASDYENMTDAEKEALLEEASVEALAAAVMAFDEAQSGKDGYDPESPEAGLIMGWDYSTQRKEYFYDENNDLKGAHAVTDRVGRQDPYEESEWDDADNDGVIDEGEVTILQKPGGLYVARSETDYVVVEGSAVARQTHSVGRYFTHDANLGDGIFSDIGLDGDGMLVGVDGLIDLGPSGVDWDLETPRADVDNQYIPQAGKEWENNEDYRTESVTTYKYATAGGNVNLTDTSTRGVTVQNEFFSPTPDLEPGDDGYIAPNENLRLHEWYINNTHYDYSEIGMITGAYGQGIALGFDYDATLERYVTTASFTATKYAIKNGTAKRTVVGTWKNTEGFDNTTNLTWWTYNVQAPYTFSAPPPDGSDPNVPAWWVAFEDYFDNPGDYIPPPPPGDGPVGPNNSPGDPPGTGSDYTCQTC